MINKYRVWFRCWPDIVIEGRDKGMLIDAYTAIDADFQTRVSVVQACALAGHHIRSSDIVITRIAPEPNDELRLQTIEQCARILENLRDNVDTSKGDYWAGAKLAYGVGASEIRVMAREGKHDD